MSKTHVARYNIGQVIRHRVYAMRGVIFDVDAAPGDSGVEPASGPAMPELHYRLFAEDNSIPYVACIAEHDLVPDLSGEPVNHPEIDELFDLDEERGYRRRKRLMN